MTTHKGSCHCGDVSFEVDGDFAEGNVCNCSLCSRAGWILGFVAADAIRLQSEESAVTDYQFGAKNIHHLFCSRCGVRAYGYGADAEGNRMYSINLRCLHDFDITAVAQKPYDGAAR